MIIPNNPYQDSAKMKSVESERTSFKKDDKKIEKPDDSGRSASIRDTVELSSKSEEIRGTETADNRKNVEISEADLKTAGEGWFSHGYSQAMQASEAKQ